MTFNFYFLISILLGIVKNIVTLTSAIVIGIVIADRIIKKRQ